MDPIPVQKRPYLGRPENQKDPLAIVPARPQQQQAGQDVGLGAKPKARTKRVLPKTINAPPRLAASMSKDLQPTTDDPAKNAFFVASMSVREINNDTRFAPSTPTLMEITRLCYAELVADDVNTQKSLLPEYLDQPPAYESF